MKKTHLLLMLALCATLLASTIAHRYEPEMLIFGDVFVLTYKTAEV